MIWPFDTPSGGVLALYVATLALHAAFVGYVVAGTAYALVRRDAIAETVRDRLPFMLGCGITAGVAPLLFVQLLHQQRFYTANLLLGPRWLAVVPALIVGFYLLYLGKTRRRALIGALACFAFVAWSWSELHELMAADPAWRDFYAAGSRVYLAAAIAPRMIVFAGGMAASFATIAAWSANDRKPLATIALCARVVSIGGAIWLWRTGFELPEPARAWFVVLVVALVVEVISWIFVRRGSGRALAIATGAGAAVLVAAVVVREAPRVVLVEPPHPASAGAIVFAVSLVLGAGAIAWIVRAISTASTR